MVVLIANEMSKKESSNSVKTKNTEGEYGRIVLTLKNCLLPEEKLSPTPSLLDGLDADTEADLRTLGCELIQTAGILLKLPQVAMATAQVLFQRFYFSKSFVRQNFEVTGMGCLYLASKIEEAPRRIRDVINVFHHIKQFNNQKNLTPVILDQNYISLKYQVIKAERRVLKELGFCVHVKHPHKLIVLYLQVIGLESKQSLMQMAWNYMNDSLRTDVFVRYQPETIACACIYLTARKLKIALPRSPPWFSIFKVEEADIQDVCMRVLRIYNRSKPKQEDLEKKVQDLAKKFEESRMRNKTGVGNLISGNNTPNSPANNDKKQSPKRSYSDRSRSRTNSDSPRHKRYKRSRSRSYDKYKKSRSRRSRSYSPPPKRYKDNKRYRSRSRSYDEKPRDPKKRVSDRYKEGKDYYRDDRYRRDDDRYKREDEKYRKDDDYRYSRDDDAKYKKSDDRYNDEDSKYRKDDDKYRKDDDSSKSKKDDKYRKEEDTVKYKKDEKKDDDKYKKDYDMDRYKKEDENGKYKKEEEKKGKEEDVQKHKKDKSKDKDEDSKKVKVKHSSSKHKSSGEKKKKKKYHVEEVLNDEEDDDIEIIHVKKEKKAR